MKKVICDICKKDIITAVTAMGTKPVYFILKIFGNLTGNTHMNKDICHDCFNKIQTFVEKMVKQ